MAARGVALIEGADLIVFVDTPTPVRMERVRKRETIRYGNRIMPGGDMHETHVAFLQWASRYDDLSFTGRSRARHETWLSRQTVTVLRLDGTKYVGDLVASAIAALPGGR